MIKECYKSENDRMEEQENIKRKDKREGRGTQNETPRKKRRNKL